ncbi:MAG: hypothetical protein GYA15_10510 [Leptolinea sp.]|nr:hypothetical protein [Leptolinea sp.]
MIATVEEYLEKLKANLEGCDAAILQDALSDAEEYLRNGLETARAADPVFNEAEALGKLIEEFGTPEEFAADYRKVEARVRPTFAAPLPGKENASIFYRTIGIFTDPSAWSALLFMLLSLVTGVIYFTWAVTGLSLSVGLLVLIISLPLIGLFLLSVRGIALVEGRIVEALLGVRMPRRPIFVDRNISWWARFKILLGSKHTWLALVYMILMLPLGVIYFSVFITLIALSLAFFIAPIAQLFAAFPIVYFGSDQFYLDPGLGFLSGLIGLAFAIGTMHLAKLIGGWHGSLAKALLVSD